MFAELGAFSLMLALVLAALQAGFSFSGAKRQGLAGAGEGAALGSFAATLLAFLLLIHAFVVSDFSRLKQAADRIVAELAHQYRLGYEPLAGPPQFRRVEVRATRKGVTVRTRTGYVSHP